MKKINFLIAVLALILVGKSSYSQQEVPITTAVPVLTIAPDSRSGGMGDVGVAISPDANSQFWNPAKYSFCKEDFGLSISHTPWLKQLINDMSISYLSGYKHLGTRQSFGVSLRYFSLGSITYTSPLGTFLGEGKPHEYSIDGSYSLLLSPNMSGSVALRFIYSNLSTNIAVQGAGVSKPGIAFAGDLAFFYTKDLDISDKTGNLSFGVNISNLGTKISYTDQGKEDFIPANIRLGGAFTYDLDPYNKLLFALDLNKLLVPTPIYGQQPNDSISVATAMFTSFYDAPYGFSEELHELMISVGAEYWYNSKFALRAGYFHENQNKGNRKYFTTGIGLKFNVFSLDFSYLISLSQQNPLEGTMRFTLGFNFGAMKDTEKKL